MTAYDWYKIFNPNLYQVGAPAANEGDEDEDMNDADADADVDADADADADVIDDDMDVDAEGEDEEDAEGEEDVEMTPAQPPPVIKNSKTAKTSPSAKRTKQVTPKKAAQSFVNNADDSDDDELSDLSSDDEAINAGEEDAEGDEEDEELDADGDDIEEDQDAEGEAEGGPDVEARPGPGDIDSDDDSRGETPDLSRMTQRQRARFEGLDESHYQALSNGKPCLELCLRNRDKFTDLLLLSRGSSQEAFYCRRESNATCRDGSEETQPQRKTQRGGQGELQEMEDSVKPST